MAATTGLIKVAEFERVVQDERNRYELRHGEVVTLPPAKMRHNRAERRIVRALENRIGAFGYVSSEVAFRPLPEYEVWIADVAFLSEGRDRSTSGDDWIAGAPDLVVEVLSPANTALEMQDREDICLRNGARQFWTVSIERKTVKVTTAEGRTAIHWSEDEIDLAEYGGGKLPVSEIFGE